MSEPRGGQQAREIVERIRNEEYLLDLDGESDKVKRGAKSLHKKLNSALQLLSEDLYSHQTHFVLELVQNADDNEYAPGVVPKLTFKLQPERLILINNESGFTEKNVRALCSVGESSKAKKAGYIGEKGIGFKSVFTVSNAPEIHSNGYHFRFDRTDESNLLGYVVPHWCETIPHTNEDVTTIVLPARGDYRFSSQTLEDLDARLLLFLTKVRELAVHDADRKILYSRKDDGAHSYLTTAITPETETGPEETQESRFVRVAVPLSMKEVPDEKRPDTDSSSLVLAFPIDSNGAADPQPASQVFAFLPIRPFGFKFSVQADFILSTSREDIHADRPWNKLLRDGISVAFKTAVEEFKRSEQLAFSYLKFLPSEGEVQDAFFKPVVEQIFEYLATTNSLLSAGGEWRIPKDLRYGDERFCELFPSPFASELFGFDYVDARVQASAELLQRLGAKPVTFGDCVNVFKTHGEWLKQQPKTWKARFYAYLADLDLKQILGAGLATAPCVPTSDGGLVVPAQTSVFYPLSRGKKYGFEHELTIIDSDLLELASTHTQRVHGFFAALNVKTDEPFDLVTSHIFPRHRGDAWKCSGNSALLGHLRYIKDKLADYIAGAERTGKTAALAIVYIRIGIWVGTKKKNSSGQWIFDRGENLYFSKEYKPVFSVEGLLGADIDDDKLVSPLYLENGGEASDAEAESWRLFLGRIGVHEEPRLIISSDGRADCSDELACLLDSPQSSIRKVTLECIDRHWDYFGKYQTYVAHVGKNSHQRETNFAVTLRSMKAPSRRRVTVPIEETFYPTAELKSIFGDKLTFVDAKLENTGLLDACKITHRLDANACVKRLQQLRVEGGDTIPQLQAIYRYLEQLWAKEAASIKYAFVRDGLIRVKGVHQLWARPDEVSWRPNSPFLDTLYPPLQGQYRDFSTFFIDKLGVPSALPTAKWVQALRRLDQIESTDERCQEAIAIYRRASRDLTPRFGRSEISTPEWLGVFETEAVFLNQRAELVANDESLFANDSPELAELFSDDPAISLLAVPFEDLPRALPLLQAVKVQLLSKSTEVRILEVPGGKRRDRLTKQVRQAIPYIGRVLYAKNLESFEKALENGLFRQLFAIEVVEVPELELEVVLAGVSKRTATDIARSGDQVLIRAGALAEEDQLGTELCKFLGAPDDLADTVTRVLLTEDESSIENFLRVRKIGPLPADLLSSLLGTAGARPESIEVDNEEFGETTLSGSVLAEDAPAGVEEDLASEGVEPAAVDVEIAGRREPTGEAKHVKREGADPGAADLQLASRNGWAPSDTAASECDSSIEIPPVRGLMPAPSRPATGATGRVAPPAGSGENANGQVADVSSDGRVSPHSQGVANDADTAGQAMVPSLPYSGHSSGDGPGHSRVRLPRGRAQSKRTRSGRLMSYAASPGEAQKERDSDSRETVAARDATGKAAVDYFLATQSARWKSLTPMPHNNPGFDVRAVAHDGSEEVIEVKGQSAAWTEHGVALTPTELMAARRWGDRYWLCVVEYAQDETRRALYLLKNPYGLTQQFRFDSGWKSASLSEAAVPLRPAAGLQIEIKGKGSGRILSAQKKGQFYKIHVVLDGGRQLNMPFNPATMKLSAD